MPQRVAIVGPVTLEPHRTFGRPATATIVLVLVLHAALLLALADLSAWRDRGTPAAEQAPLQVWLLDAFKPSPPAAAAAAPQVPATRPQPEAPRPATTEADSAAITLPAAEPGGAPAAEAAPVTSQPVAPPSPPPPPLNLTLPRGGTAPWRAVNPALDDRGARSARATFESRLARELGGDGTWVEERLGTDAVRFRRGGTCVDMERARSDQLDGFNRSSSLKPWVAKQPRAC